MAWLAKPGRDPLIVPDSMPETIARCLREGWAIVPDPRGQAALPAESAESAESLPEALPVEDLVDPDPDATRARAEEAQVVEMQTTKARNAAARKWVERKH